MASLTDVCITTALALSRKVVDDSQKANAENAASSGLEVRITRTYDNVGLSNKRICMWCVSRCGVNMTLEEARYKGAFQRHEGCGCDIEYRTQKGIWRTQTNWQHNEWQDTDPRETDTRKKENLNDHLISLEEAKSRIRNGKWPLVSIEDYGLEFVEDEKPFFPSDHIMAGKGCKTGRKIDELQRLVRDYRYFDAGEKDWSKRKVRYQVYDEYGQIREIEVHYYQHPKVGKVEDKIKFDEYDRMFVDEWD